LINNQIFGSYANLNHFSLCNVTALFLFSETNDHFMSFFFGFFMGFQKNR